MRDEREMFNLILDYASANDTIRAVYLNGSRTNSHAPKDRYQDYDIVYVVNQLEPFLADRDWLKHFGELAVKQEPDYLSQLVGQEVDHDDYYMFLMLFTDGVRIDLKVLLKDNVAAHIAEDQLIEPLLDKDQLLTLIPAEASDRMFWVTRPTEGAFISVCNDFWWCLQNVGKGIKRQEFSYAQDMYETVIRDCFNQVINWRIGMDHDYQVSVGKAGKFLPHFLSAKKWQQYLSTYSGANEAEMWASLFTMIELFKKDARELATAFNFEYNYSDENGMICYLETLKRV